MNLHIVLKLGAHEKIDKFLNEFNTGGTKRRKICSENILSIVKLL